MLKNQLDADNLLYDALPGVYNDITPIGLHMALTSELVEAQFHQLKRPVQREIDNEID